MEVVRCRETCDRSRCEKIGCFAEVVIYATGDAVLEESEVDTGVVGSGLFPLEVGVVAFRIERLNPCAVAGGTRVETRFLRVGVDSVGGIVAAHSLLTCDTPAETEFKVVHHVACSFEEVHVGNLPCHSGSGEDTPAVVLAEARRSVGTYSTGDEEDVVVVVVETSEERFKVQLVPTPIVDIDVVVGLQEVVDSVVGRNEVVNAVAIDGVFTRPCVDVANRVDIGGFVAMVVHALPRITCGHVECRFD